MNFAEELAECLDIDCEGFRDGSLIFSISAQEILKIVDIVARKYVEDACKEQRKVCAKYVIDNFAIPLNPKNKIFYKKMLKIPLVTEVK